jgi:hypothetical protein
VSLWAAVQESPRLHFDTCAVVGNAGSLKRTAYGLLIDQHDAVLRLNQAPVGGYEQWVGRKTTFRLLNNKWTTVRTPSHHTTNRCPHRHIVQEEVLQHTVY